MNPFPDTLIVPTTANRLRATARNEALIQKLLELEVSSASFLMPDEEMPATNNETVAIEDLKAQLKKLPAEIRDKIFPKPTPLSPIPDLSRLPARRNDDDDDDDDEGDGMMGGMGMSMSPGLNRELEREHERQQRRKSESPGMSM